MLAETKLLKSDKHGIEDKLNNWSIIGRYDSQDCQKHMGLILLKSKKSQLRGPIKIDHKTAKRNGSLHLEGLVVWLTNGLTLGFLYCKSTPTVKEVEAIKKSFDQCNILLGDLNLSHRVKSDQEKLLSLCHPSKVSTLTEITRSISNNQLDILVNKDLVDKSFATSFINLISDHKSTTIGINI